jgi:hypothetical protein
MRRVRENIVAVENQELYSECMSAALVVQHAKRMCRVVICGLSGCTICFHIISLTVLFWGKMLLDRKYDLIFYSISV